MLVTGPGIRAVAAGAQRVVLLCGPRGRAAADLLPGVDEVIEHRLPWIDPAPAPVDPQEMAALVTRLAAVAADEAVIFTSFHQSPLPLALLLRMAGVARIAAISDDYPGSLLDVRHRVPVGVPEAERALSLAAAAGYLLGEGDEPHLRLRPVPPPPPEAGAPGYVVLHPGSAAPRDRGRGPPRWWSVTPGRRTWPPATACRWSASSPPTVPFGQWGPWRVPTARCPVPGHPCLSDIQPGDVLDALRLLGVPPDRVPTGAAGPRAAPEVVTVGGGSGR